MKALDIQKGDRYGRLNVIEERFDGGRDRKFFVECDCGTGFVVRLASMRSGITKSCGCYSRENSTANNRKHGHNTRKNGASPTYYTWAAMIQRCTNEKDKSYARYGGRGINVDERWLSFENFLEDMGERPKDLSIDRIDNNKGYYKNNCRWATRSQQMLNRRKFTWKKNRK